MSAIELAILRVAGPRLKEERDRAVASVVTGKLDEKAYGFACGYIHACDDLDKILEQVMTDIQGS